MSLIIVAGLPIAALVMFFWYIHLLEVRGLALSSGQERSTRLGPEIHGSQRIGQSFTFPGGHIPAACSVKFATCARLNSSICNLYVKEQGPEGRVLTEQSFSAHSIQDNLFHLFRFPELTGKSGRYYLEFQAQTAEPGNSLYIWISNKDRFEQGQLFENGVPVQGDMAFRVYRRLPFVDLLKRLTENRPGPLAQASLYLILIFLTTGFNLLFLLSILVSPVNKNDRI